MRRLVAALSARSARDGPEIEAQWSKSDVSPLEEIRSRLRARIDRLSLPRLEAIEAFADRLEEANRPGATVGMDGGTPRPPEVQVARRVLPEVRTEPPIGKRDRPRAPIHRISEQGTYFVTCGTLHKQHLFRGRERLTLLEDGLLTLSEQYGWQLEAWAVFSNHYHFVAHSGPHSGDLGVLLKHIHGTTAARINELDREPQRMVWYNFWDTQLTFERSYLARLNYVHQNAVHHGLVTVANQYPWCSAAWFERTATRVQVKTIYGIKIDRVHAPDAFEPEAVLDE